MPLSDEEFKKKTADLVGDIAASVAGIFSQKINGIDQLDNIRVQWQKFTYRFFELVEHD